MDITISNLPSEVIESGILPYLKFNDLLRFRRTCKRTMFIVNDYIRVNPKLAPEIQIDEKGDKTLKEFMNLNIPTTKLFINNVSGKNFYKKNEKYIKTFLQNSGRFVRDLRVDQISPIIYGKEWDFFDALGNMQKFEASHYGFGQHKLNSQRYFNWYGEEKLWKAHQDSRYRNNMECPIPKGFSRLKFLKIGPEVDKYKLPYTTIRSYDMVTTAKELEFISLPLSSDDTGFISREDDTYVTSAMAFSFFGMELQNIDFPRNGILKTIDFHSFHNEFSEKTPQVEATTSQCFLNFCAECVMNDVKLMNVAANWFSDLQEYQNHNFERVDYLGLPIISLVNLHPNIFRLNMPNLEHIEIRENTKYFEGVSITRTTWPSLKSVDITVEPEVDMNTSSPVSTTTSDNFFRLFFENIQRNNLIELRLDFSKVAKNVMLLNSEHIARASPNLKKVTIVQWPGNSKALLKLFNGCSDLEEISLEYCHNLGNMAFIGLDIQNPDFLKLTKLKKLTLKGLDQMPQVTDILFSMVIRHMNLSELTLTSDSPVKLVTVAGIRALLNGNFADSIERFSLKNLALDKVSDGELKMLEKEFRSYYML